MGFQISLSRWSLALTSTFFVGCMVGPAEPDESTDEQLGTASAAQHCGHSPTPVVFDTDMDFDDVSALAFLCQQHKLGNIDLRAVTVENNGVGVPGHAIRNARCTLQACGLPNVPVADGSPTPVNAVDPQLPGAIDFTLAAVYPGCTATTDPAPISAAQLLANAVHDAHGRAMVIATGPLTNLSAAFDLDQGHCHGHGHNHDKSDTARDIDKLFIMGGAIDVPGSLFNAPAFDGSQETNIWIDPPAAADVVGSVKNIYMIPLDATNQVPITTEFLGRLANDHTTAEANLVYTIMQQPIPQLAVSLHIFYWWDVLAAVTATDNQDVVDFDNVRINVVVDGPSAGRTMRVSHGGVKIKAALGANQGQFEDTFLDGLNGREADDE